MKRTLLILIGSLIFSFTNVLAQQYTASGYWKMEHDPVYLKLLERQSAGENLSSEEQNTLIDYKTKLIEYFDKMSDDEKSVYYKNRSTWTAQPSLVDKAPAPSGTDVFSGERSMYTQYLVTSGLFGALYGGAAIAILGMDSPGAAGIPLLTAGASVLVPVLTLKDKYVSYNSLALSMHGKAVGAMQGLALGVLITGDNVEDGKLLLAMGTGASIGLGRLGFSLGKNKPWTEGQVALYNYYGFLMPLEGLALNLAFEIENPRLWGLTSLVFGAGGYWIGDMISKKTDFTRGDITSTGTLALLNAGLGFAIMADVESRNYDAQTGIIMIPALGALGGSLVGHLIHSNTRLTYQQGRNVALASTAGAAMGAGITAIFTPETATPYYIASYITGMTTYGLIVGMYKRDNITASTDNDKKSRWNVNLMPQNILLNKRIVPYAIANPGKRINLLPAFSASVNF